jgi:2-C-methyl-D-erythritol 2,4-cyclodiphosphate synthase
MKLLAKTVAMVRDNGFTIQNIDTIIFAEIPKIGPYRQKIQHNIAAAAEMEPNCVNVKATTTEGLGAIGKGDGIGAMSVVLVEQTLTRTSRKSETRNQKSETNTKSQFSNAQNPKIKVQGLLKDRR